ncbi:MAG: hypothetical protein AB7R89_10155 [Dehalococcoidia bacterium]
MQSETSTLEQLRIQLTAVGLTLDDERLSRLLPVYVGVLSGANRLALLDLGETEPAMIYALPGDPTVREDRR